jgi:hypothetical protein
LASIKLREQALASIQASRRSKALASSFLCSSCSWIRADKKKKKKLDRDPSYKLPVLKASTVQCSYTELVRIVSPWNLVIHIYLSIYLSLRFYLLPPACQKKRSLISIKLIVQKKLVYDRWQEEGGGRRNCVIMNIRDCKSGEIKRKGKKVDAPIEEEQSGNEVACVRWDSLNCARCLAQDTPWPPSPALRGHAAELQSWRHGPALLRLSLSRIPFPSLPCPARPCPPPSRVYPENKILLSNL